MKSRKKLLNAAKYIKNLLHYALYCHILWIKKMQIKNIKKLKFKE